jgi:predicted HD phosphohydrolase
METVQFTQMKDGTAEEYKFLQRHELAYANQIGNRVLAAFIKLNDSLSGYQVTRYEHSLQVATRAWRDGADQDWVVSALLHDIGDFFAPYDHDKYAALILRPFVREQCRWCVEMHGEFQLVYYGQYYDGYNQKKRDRHQDHPFFNDCVEFCERWDQASFDPSYDTLPLEFFKPLVADVFARPAKDGTIINAVPQPLANSSIAESR